MWINSPRQLSSPNVHVVENVGASIKPHFSRQAGREVSRNHRTEDSIFYLGAQPRALDLGFTPVGTGLAAQPVSASAMDIQTVGYLLGILRAE